jgi:exonuclease III
MIVTWNVFSLNRAGAFKSLKQVLGKYKVDIASLQEGGKIKAYGMLKNIPYFAAVGIIALLERPLW